MASRKLNVLVYTGTGTTINSVKQCIYTLRRLLSPNYAVIPVTESALLKEPWAPSCALLVFPGGADLGYCRILNGSGNRLISHYVRNAGGRYLGFCAGGYYGSRRCEFEVGDPEMEVVGSRELSFFPGTCRGGAFKGFRYASEKGAKAVRLVTHPETFPGTEVPEEFKCYFNGGSVFVEAERFAPDGVEILAEYADDLDVESGKRRAAVVYCKAGDGAALLTGPHPEFAAVNLSPQEGVPGYNELIDSLAADDALRTSFLRACLTKLGLEVSQEDSSVPSLSKLHLSAADTTDVGLLVHSFGDIVTTEENERFIKDVNDTFHLERPASRWSMTGLTDALQAPKDQPLSTDTTTDQSQVVKRIVSHEQEWPEAKETPYFNHALFYNSLFEFRKKDREAEKWGDVLLYGEVVTSTNTLLEKNPALLSKLPTGFTLAATTQVAGRGRGNNVWVSPAGALIMSTVINHPAHLATSRPIVFVQYLAAVAIVEAIQSYGPGYGEMPVKLKWPNDIYALDPNAGPNEKKYAKIGGILSNCAYSDGKFQVVLGIGINTTNARPTTSLNALVDKINQTRKGLRLPQLSIERLLARILTRLEVLYNEFCRTGFSKDLEERYYKNWLHTNQIVTLEAEGGIRARVLGITRDWGMLKAEELREDGVNGSLRSTGKVWALQSDENSFDFWKGLVKRKV
ncbi:biotin holocarboxylase synthetase [Coniochaeta pulveracea]|uniref:Biotin holocarboxylase synthetase n=1 Tax=Coniochaeta pulveracea TaxID=177199 RepID=A0A420Y526_9PEZI|nr:biotin holocarboxylase synthetase [Coniochaeta pulveracea]